MKLPRKAAVFGMAAATFAGAAIVYAAWNSTVDGTGSAASTTADSGTGDVAAVTPVAADDLYPGAVKTTRITVTNDNDYPVEVLKVRAGSSRTAGTCAADTVRTDALGDGTTALAKVGGGTVIPAGQTGTYELVLRMHNDATDACKSQSFVIGDGTTSTDNLVAEVRSAASTTGNSW